MSSPTQAEQEMHRVMVLARHENRVRETATKLGELEAQRAAEYERLTVLNGIKNWDASQRVDTTFAVPIRQAQAEHEIALEALRRLRKCQ